MKKGREPVQWNNLKHFLNNVGIGNKFDLITMRHHIGDTKYTLYLLGELKKMGYVETLGNGWRKVLKSIPEKYSFNNVWELHY